MIVCSPQMGLAAVSNSGGEVHDYQMLKHLADLGVDFQAILPQGRPCGPIARVQVTYVPISKGRYANWVFTKSALGLYRRRPFDLLRIHSMRYVGLAGLVFRACHQEVPIVANHLHLSRDVLDRALTWLVVRYADAIVAISRFSRRQLVQDLGADPHKIHVIYCGVSDFYQPDSGGTGLLAHSSLANNQIVLFVGGLKPRKNLDFLLTIFRQVSVAVPQARLVLGGDGEERGRLEALARQLGIGDLVYFAGFLSEEEKLAWLNAATVFVSPSRLEGFGMNVAEAMACGKPAVVSAAGALPEVVEDGVTGYVVPLDDKEGFVTAIVRLLRDPALARKLGAAGQRRVRERFSWDRAACQVKCIYEDVLACRRAA